MSWDFFMESYQRNRQRLDDWQQLNIMAHKDNWRIDWDLKDLLVKRGKVTLVTDSSFIIRFATANLFEMNGYKPKEVLGKTPSLFQGEQTAATTKATIKEAVAQLKPFYVTLINYRKDGSLYKCEVEGYPVFTKENKHSHFIAFEQIVP